jgi:exodeoxyribonuclease V beta subunit
VRTPEGTRRISPGDIAVLTRTNRECLEMQEHLGKRGIPSSIRKQEGLFRSAEAWDLRVFLDAVDHPRDPGRLRLFLGCGLAGKNYREIPEMTDAEYESWQALFIRLNRLFEEGFAVLCRVAFSELDVLSKWIALPGGERRAANLHRIFEIVNERQSRMDLSLAECVEQIDRWIEEADPEHLQPMERDRESVVVMTVHSSKGLEFPVVFLGGGIGRLSARRGEEVFYTENRTRIFDLWGTNAGRERRDVESLAEMRRLLYVAMTRAKYRLSLPLFEPGPRSGCLANLLRPEGEGGPEWLRFLERPENRPYFEIKGHGDGIPAGTVAPRAGTPPALRAPRCFSRDFRKAPAFRVASFTGIVQGPGAEFENSAVQGPGEPARTDASVDELFASPAEPSPGDAALPLPRGARTGSMLHEVLEHLDFSIARPFQRFEEFAGDGETRGRIEDRVVPALKRFDLPPELFPSVLEILWHVLKCPLSGAAGELFTLEEVEERRHEVEFYLPVHPVSRLRTELDVSGDDPVSIRLSWNARMLKGVMDLVFRHRGRYYLADWKSNDLGDGPAAYAPRHLGAAMKRHHYPLQYWIYLAALERLLARQHPGFDYDRHFGGVFYLFVRGMREHDPRFGVYRHTPSRGALRRFAKDLFPETAGDGFETKGDVS